MELIWHKDIVFDPAFPKDCLMDIIEPEGRNRPPLFIYFHGGGLEAGDHHITPYLEYLAWNYGFAVASAGYRMYPGARFPDFVEDAAKAVAWLQNVWHAGDKYRRVVVGGSSAGGYLSMMLCFAEHFLKDAGADASRIDGYVFNAGQPTTHYNILRERGEDKRLVRIDEAAPLWYVTESFEHKRTVPLLVLAADNDMPNRMEQNVMFCAALHHFGYPVYHIDYRLMEQFGHCAYNNHQDEQGRYIFADMIAEFYRSCIGSIG